MPVSEAQPAIGGLLLWSDEMHYLRLDRGLTGDREVALLGWPGNEVQVSGRGTLPKQTLEGEQAQAEADGEGRVWLRLECSGDRVTAFCSADEKEWCTLGHVPFVTRDPIQVGVYANGEIDRTIYHGPYPDGSAICFESFQLWHGIG